MMAVRRRFGLVHLLLLAFAGHSALAQTDAGGDGTKPGAKPSTGTRSGKSDPPEFPSGPLQAKFAKKLGDGYKVRETKHFFVMYNTDEKVLREFIQRIEKTFDSVHRFALAMGISIEYPKEKLPVVFCDTFEEFAKRSEQLGGSAATKDFAGLYFPRANFSLFYDMAKSDHAKQAAEKADALAAELRTTRDPNDRRKKTHERQWTLNQAKSYQDRNNKSVVQHEVAHQLLHNFQVHRRDIPSNPVWFVEGLATLFEPPPGSSGAGYNVVNQYRLWRLREADKGGPIPELTELVKDPSLLRGGGDQMDKGYAQAWGLTYYLAQRQKKNLQKYIELIKQRKPDEAISPERQLEDFEKCFGKLDDAFKKKWIEFMRKVPYAPPS